MQNVTSVSIDLLFPDENQPRKVFNEESIDNLAKSIQEYGILNPLIVTKKDSKYQIVAGERRYRAAKKIGLKEVPIIITDKDENINREIALIENIQRENLNPIDEAITYEKIMLAAKITEKELGEKLGISQSTIANKIRILKLPQEIINGVKNKKISERHARSLLSIPNSDKQIKIYNQILQEKLTVKELENRIKEVLNNTKEDEKESDNMNNGNFFPSFNNPVGQDNGASLNTMNMQSMEIPNALPQQPEVVMPTIVPPLEPTPVNEPQQVIAPGPNVVPVMQEPIQIETPLFNPNLNTSQPPLEPVAENMATINPFENIQALTPPTIEEPSVQPVPSFDTSFVAPILPTDQISEPALQQPVQPIIEQNEQPTPVVELNNQQIMNQPEVITPVEQPSPMPEQNVELSIPQDKLANITNFLIQNNIEYKLYNNETGHCIIIEL